MHEEGETKYCARKFSATRKRTPILLAMRRSDCGWQRRKDRWDVPHWAALDPIVVWITVVCVNHRSNARYDEAIAASHHKIRRVKVLVEAVVRVLKVAGVVVDKVACFDIVCKTSWIPPLGLNILKIPGFSQRRPVNCL